MELTMPDKSHGFHFNISELHAYYGFCKNLNDLKSTSSGGAATIIAREFVRRKYVVFGVKYSDDFKRAEYCCIENEKDLEKIKGSKYVQTERYVEYKGERFFLFSLVEKLLRNGQSVLFIGLGCTVGALRFYLKKHSVDSSNLYVIELLCHSLPVKQVQSAYIEFLETMYDAEISEFSMRYKGRKMLPIKIHAKFRNGKEFTVPSLDADLTFVSSILVRKSCYHCHFKGNGHMGDLIVGDYWGITKKMEGYNKNGVSLLIVKNAVGKRMIDMVSPKDFEMGETDIEYALKNNKMYYTSTPKHKFRDMAMQDLDKYGISFVAKKYQNKLVYLLKKCNLYSFLVTYTPRSIKNLIMRYVLKQ